MEKKPHQRVLEHFDNTINELIDDIIGQNYITKEELKVKIRACVINSIKSSKRQGTHEAQLILLNEKLNFKSNEYIRIYKESAFERRLYKQYLSDNELNKVYEEINNFRSENKKQTN